MQFLFQRPSRQSARRVLRTVRPRGPADNPQSAIRNPGDDYLTIEMRKMLNLKVQLSAHMHRELHQLNLRERYRNASLYAIVLMLRQIHHIAS